MNHDPISDVVNFLQQPAFVFGPTWPTAVFWVLVLASVAIAVYAFAAIPGQRLISGTGSFAFWSAACGGNKRCGSYRPIIPIIPTSRSARPVLLIGWG